MPSQYGSGAVESEPSSMSQLSLRTFGHLLMCLRYAMEQNYIPPVRVSQSTTTSGTTVYASTVSSSPGLYQSRSMPVPGANQRRPSDLSNSSNHDPSYGQTYRRPSASYDSIPSNDYSLTHSQTVPSMGGLSQTQMASPNFGSTSVGGMSQYSASVSR